MSPEHVTEKSQTCKHVLVPSRVVSVPCESVTEIQGPPPCQLSGKQKARLSREETAGPGPCPSYVPPLSTGACDRYAAVPCPAWQRAGEGKADVASFSKTYRRHREQLPGSLGLGVTAGKTEPRKAEQKANTAQEAGPIGAACPPWAPAKTQAAGTHGALCPRPAWGPAQGRPLSRPSVLAAGPLPETCLLARPFPPQHKQGTKQEWPMMGNGWN